MNPQSVSSQSSTLKMLAYEGGPLRKVSLMAGWIYLLTFISVPTLFLYRSIHQSHYITSGVNDTPAIIGGLLEVIVALAGIATAIVLYPLLKKQNERLALGLVGSRVLEACTIFVGVAFLLAAVTMHQREFGDDALIPSQVLVILYDRIFLLGQGFIPAIDDILLGVLLYKSRLVPRSLSLIGIFGAFPLIAGFLAVILGTIDRISPMAILSAMPVAIFEVSLGIYLVLKGFRPTSPLFKNA